MYARTNAKGSPITNPNKKERMDIARVVGTPDSMKISSSTGVVFTASLALPFHLQFVYFAFRYQFRKHAVYLSNKCVRV